MPKIAFLASVLFIALFLFIASAASTMGAQEQLISGETFSPSTSSPVLLNYSSIPNAIYNPYPEVTIGTSGTGNLTAQGPDKDYIFYPNNGTILSVSGGALDGVASASIDYRYAQQNQWTSSATTIWGGLSNSLIPGMMVFVIVSLLFLTFKNLN